MPSAGAAHKASFLDKAMRFSQNVAMDRAQLPLNALRAFEAAARHLNFTRAGIELCVSQGAVSHQVAQLERRLGTRQYTTHGIELDVAFVQRIERTHQGNHMRTYPVVIRLFRRWSFFIFLT